MFTTPSKAKFHYKGRSTKQLEVARMTKKLLRNRLLHNKGMHAKRIVELRKKLKCD